MKTSKGLFGIGTSLLFVMLGVYLFTVKAHNPATENPELVKWVGIACTAFFGLVAFAGIKMLVTGSAKK